MNKAIVSAPGKLLLMGEHAVVYGYPCIVTAVDARIKLTALKTNEQNFILNAPDVGIKNYQKPIASIGQGEILEHAKCVELAVKNFKNKFAISHGIDISIAAGFSKDYGLGSSSAVIVCTVKALAELNKLKLSKQELFDLAYQTVLEKQGVGSGFDIAAAIFGGTLYFITGGKTIVPLNISKLPLVVGYSGIKADTTSIVKDLAAKREKYPQNIDRIFKAMGELVDQGKTALLNSDWVTLGKLFNFNQEYLRDLGVSTEKLENLISSAKTSGAYGAKLSGAGGGDCMISLCPENKTEQVKKSVIVAKGIVVNLATNAEGVKIEG